MEGTIFGKISQSIIYWRIFMKYVKFIDLNLCQRSISISVFIGIYNGISRIQLKDYLWTMDRIKLLWIIMERLKDPVDSGLILMGEWLKNQDF